MKSKRHINLAAKLAGDDADRKTIKSRLLNLKAYTTAGHDLLFRSMLGAKSDQGLDSNRIQNLLQASNRNRLIVALLIPTDHLLAHT